MNEMWDAETALALYERIRRDTGYRMAPYRVVAFVAQMMKRDEFDVLHAIGVVRVAEDDSRHHRVATDQDSALWFR